MNFRIFSPQAALWRLLTALTVVIMSLSVISCGSDDDDMPEPVPPVVDPGNDPEPELKGRTVLVYMVANNSLGTMYHCDEADLREMIQATSNGLPADCRLLVYHNPPRCSESNPCVLIDVTSTGLKTLKTYPFAEEGESVTTERMQQVVADMKELAPAADYGMVFW
ncbi:MAG: hypothetical protein K2K72_06035, partial [Duncaniella sp.]|nr:hypothetical protein [Duncaniella sp.]